MNKGKPTVLFVDDEPDQIQYFMDEIDGLILPGETEKTSVMHEKVDGALSLLKEFRPDIKAVVIDIKMPPGNAFRDENHDHNLRTGFLLFERLDMIQKEYDVDRGHPLPLAFLTQLNDPKIHADVENIFLERRPKEIQRIGIWIKVGLEPKDFAAQFSDWINTLRDFYGIS